MASIFVSGNDVYVSGYQLIGGMMVATYWKNNVPITLSSGAEGYSIFVYGTDVYMSGLQISGNIYVPVYWKNSTLVTLPLTHELGSAPFIFVQ